MYFVRIRFETDKGYKVFAAFEQKKIQGKTCIVRSAKEDGSEIII